MIVEIMNHDSDNWKNEYSYQEEFKLDDQYHHSAKGCEIDKQHDHKFTIGNNRNMEYAFCKTHNCFCSKTGWEFHHYRGTNSLEL